MLRLRKLKIDDKKYFAQWWRDVELLKFTSGVLKRISDEELDEYFQNIFTSTKDYHFLITLNKKVIGHISLSQRKNGWYEIQIIIGEEQFRGKGYGSKAIKLAVSRAKRLGIAQIYLEVRPNNTRAIHAYEYCGFQKVRTITYPKNKYLLKTIRMELNIDL